MKPIVKSTIWSIIERYLPSIIQIATTLYLARLISPEEYGEVALVTTFTHIALLFVSAGFSEAVILRNEHSDRLFSTVFYANIFTAIFLYLILFLTSGLIANFYEIERLSILCKVIGVNILAYSLTYIQRTVLILELNFKKSSVITFFSTLLGCLVGIIMINNGCGIWSIVSQTLSINVFQAILFSFFSKWKPTVFFSFKLLKEILPFSFRIFVNNIINSLFDNLYSLFIGKVYNSGTLGYYNRMQTVAYYTTTNFLYAIESVTYSAFSRNKQDHNYLRGQFSKFLNTTSFIVFPILITLIALGDNLIVLILTEKWLAGYNILRSLAIAFLFLPFIYSCNSFLKLFNRPDVLLRANIIKKVLGLLILIISIRFSFEIVCYGIIAYYFLDAIISFITIQKFARIQFSLIIKTIAINILNNILLLLLLLFLKHLLPINILSLIVELILAMLLYGLSALITRNESFYVLLDIFKQKKNAPNC